MARTIGEQLRRAREAAGLSKSELGRRVGWADHTNVIRVEGGGNTGSEDVEKWARECGFEILIVAAGSSESVAARLHEAEERERRIAVDLLDLLADARGTLPHLLDYFEADIQTWRRRLDQQREAINSAR